MTTVSVEKTVKDRYGLGAETRVAELCCPTDYDPQYLEVIPHEVLDRDYQPAREPSQKVTLDMPGETGGTRETVELEARLTDDEGFGTYATNIVPTRPGDYLLSAEPDDPDEDPPEKLFHVVRSSLEGRDLLLDEGSLRDLADASEGGAYLHLKDMGSELRPDPKTQLIDTDSRQTELWDNWYSLVIALLLLGAEWALRKRWHLV